MRPGGCSSGYVQRKPDLLLYESLFCYGMIRETDNCNVRFCDCYGREALWEVLTMRPDWEGTTGIAEVNQ